MATKSRLLEIHPIKVRSSLQYQEDPPTHGRYEKNRLPSEAIPDQSLSVRELLRRHTRGTLQDIAHNDIFYNEDMPDMRGLDIVERRQMVDENKELIKKTISDEKKKKDDKSKQPPPTTEPISEDEVSPKT